MLGCFKSLRSLDGEGGNAEKFPDEWDLQLLGNTIISQLSSGIPPDFLIKRYVFSILFYFTGSILLLKFQTFIRFLLILLSGILF